MKKKLVLIASLLSLAWNFYLTIGVALNATSLASRVAGGQLHTFSSALRFTYGVQAGVVVFQFIFLFQLFRRPGVWSNSSYLLARIFLILSGLSGVVNLVSRNPLERWNAIPAFALAYGYVVLGALSSRPRKK
jgi:uncharacterized membrane protein